MALECPRCGFEAEQGTPGAPCPKCGVNMRFTLLGDYVKELKQAAQAKQKAKVKPPGFVDRVGRWFLGMVCIHLFAYLMLGGVVFFVKSRNIDFEQFAKDEQSLLIASVFGIPIVATFLGVTISCGQVYLAQLVGFAIGLTGNLALLAERHFFPHPPGWQEWAAIPILGAVVGFLSGYRVTGPMYKEVAEAQDSPDDEWKTAAQPAVRELDPGMTVRRQRLIAGAVVGILFPFIVPPLLGFFMKAFSGRADMVEARMRSFDFAFQLLALFLAGVTAGSGNTKGVRQGILVGVLLYTILYFATGQRDWQLGLIRFIPSLFVSMIGGIAGQKIFGPTKIYLGPKFK